MRAFRVFHIFMAMILVSLSAAVFAQEALTPLPKKEIKRSEILPQTIRVIPKPEAPEVKPITDEQIIQRAIDDLLNSRIRIKHTAEKRLIEYGVTAIPYLVKAFRRPVFKLHLALTRVSIKIGKVGEEAFLEVLNSESGEVRWNAAKILGNIGGERSVNALIAALVDPVVRPTAVDALGLLGDKRAIPALEKLLDSEDEFVKMLVKRALKNLGVKTELPQWEF